MMMTKSKRGWVDTIYKGIKLGLDSTINTNNSAGIYDYLKIYCASESDSCKNGATYTLELCEKRETSGCKEIVYDGVAKYCGENKSASVCEQWLTTTSSHIIYFAIGGVVGLIVLLAVAIGLFCYCRRKKKMGKNQTMTGTTTGETSGTGTGTAAGTNGTGTNQATETNTCAKY